MDERLALIEPTLTYDGFSEADIVVEAVFEGMALKKQVFAELDQVCQAGRDPGQQHLDAEHRRDRVGHRRGPRSVIGTHFFSPANVMRLLEIVRGKATSKEVIATSMELAKKLGKVGVLVGNCRGFVGNRMFDPYVREAQFLVEEGAQHRSSGRSALRFRHGHGAAGRGRPGRTRRGLAHPQGISSTWKSPASGKPFAEDTSVRDGPLRPEDRRRLVQVRREPPRRCPIPKCSRLIEKWSAEAGIHAARRSRRKKSSSARIYALINEGARILEEGIALRAVDIDIIYINGYGFPAYRGGPMWYADTVGLKKVYDRIMRVPAHRTASSGSPPRC